MVAQTVKGAADEAELQLSSGREDAAKSRLVPNKKGCTPITRR
ncbi:hypothetical protein [Rhizobium leguminosarum]|nr:hypothetical protein [Rhizobium leguminosarum]